MKILVKIILLTVLALSAIAYAHTHAWFKDSEFEDRNGKIICIWVCNIDYGHEHYKRTSGYYSCPYPG